MRCNRNKAESHLKIFWSSLPPKKTSLRMKCPSDETGTCVRVQHWYNAVIGAPIERSSIMTHKNIGLQNVLGGSTESHRGSLCLYPHRRTY